MVWRVAYARGLWAIAYGLANGLCRITANMAYFRGPMAGGRWQRTICNVLWPMCGLGNYISIDVPSWS